jgi:drug/metabolite transporter (DMT)-like permease
LKERLPTSGRLGVTVAAAGVAVIVLATTPGFTEARTGDLLQLTSCLTWAIYTLGAMGVIRRNGALRVSSAVTVVAAAAVAVPACARAGLLAAPPTSRSMLAMLFLGLLCSALGHYFWYAAIHEQGATRAGAYLYVEPFITVVLAAAILGEPITLPVIAGGLLALTGVWMVERARLVDR